MLIDVIFLLGLGNGRIKHGAIAWAYCTAEVDEARIVGCGERFAVVIPADLESLRHSRRQVRHCVVIIVELFVPKLRRVTLGQLDVFCDLAGGPEVLLPRVRGGSLGH